ncbi:MAG TPA: FtsK/SpoIIIE domain-containing protein, partial [Nocardioidaceae bacterium]|nr:FtsK/SpoIIIE domain-containing protein [Nocardioidaceae bacterium]
RGRSLGLRLVLATQRPAGVINDRIRANVGVRIALRVNDEADSMDVIGEREAAHIPRSIPGRAFLKVHRDLDEFQSAYVGGVARTDAGGAIEVHDLVPGAGGAPRPSADGPTLLEAVVSATQQVMRLGRWSTPHVPWLPAMGPVVTLPELTDQVPDLPDAATVLGLADLPAQQAQRVVALDLERHQNLLVFGTSRSGKTTVLRTLAAGLIERLGPDQLHIYGLDFAGHGLHLLEAAPQCPGIVGPDEVGRIARLLRRLGSTVDERKRAMAARGLTGFSELVRTSNEPVPRILVLIDGYAGAVAVLERVDAGRLLERLERLVADGPGVGVHVVITADRRSVVPSSLTAVMTTRLVLRMAERDDYALLGVESGLARDARPGPGRGFIQGTTEIQVAVRASSDPEQEQHALAEVVRLAQERWPVPATELGRMPLAVTLEDLPSPADPLVLPIAIGDDDIRPAVLDLSAAHALVSGPPRSGRSSTLATIAAAARRSAVPPAVALFLARRDVGADGVGWDIGPVDAGDPTDLAQGVAAVSALLAQGRTVLCLCDDIDALPDAASATLEELARRGRDEAVRMVATMDNRWAQRAYSGLAPELRKSKQGILLGTDIDLDGDLVGVRLRTPLEPFGLPGRGFLVGRGVAELVQVALATDLRDRAG